MAAYTKLLMVTSGNTYRGWLCVKLTSVRVGFLYLFCPGICSVTVHIVLVWPLWVRWGSLAVPDGLVCPLVPKL